jgi:hypothetical protein
MKIRLVGTVLFHNGGQPLFAILWKALKKYTEVVTTMQHATKSFDKSGNMLEDVKRLLCLLCFTEIQHIPASTVIPREII